MKGVLKVVKIPIDKNKPFREEFVDNDKEFIQNIRTSIDSIHVNVYTTNNYEFLPKSKKGFHEKLVCYAPSNCLTVNPRASSIIGRSVCGDVLFLYIKNSVFRNLSSKRLSDFYEKYFLAS